MTKRNHDEVMLIWKQDEREQETEIMMQNVTKRVVELRLSSRHVNERRIRRALREGRNFDKRNEKIKNISKKSSATNGSRRNAVWEVAENL